MEFTIEAVYENGVFRPLSAPEGLAAEQRVTITVRPIARPATGPLEFAGEVRARLARKRETCSTDELLSRLRQLGAEE